MTRPTDQRALPPAYTLAIALKKHAIWNQDCAAVAINRLAFEGTERTAAAMRLFTLSVDHNSAINVLVTAGYNGSALALFRPQVEAYERGLWLHKGADYQEPPNNGRPSKLMRQDPLREAFLAGAGNAPGRRAMLASLGAHGDALNRIIGRDDWWARFCDYTHGGARQMQARSKGTVIEENYPPEFIAQMMGVSSALLLVTVLAMMDLTDAAEDAKGGLRPVFDALYRFDPTQPLPASDAGYRPR